MEERFAFDQVANLYKVARPVYPEALVEDVVSYANLEQGDAILEVGWARAKEQKALPSAASRLSRWIPDQKCSVPHVTTWRASAMSSCSRRRSRHGPRTEERSDRLSPRSHGTGSRRRCGFESRRGAFA